MELTISRRDDSDPGSLVLAGSIDMVSRQSLIDAGREVLDGGGSLTLDMSGVDFMDSTGIGALIELARSSEKLGRPFAVAEKSPRVRRVLEATGLDDAWPPS